MPEGNLVGSSGKAQKGSYGKVGKKKKVVVKPKPPKPQTQKPQHSAPPQDLRSPDAKQPTTAAEKRAATRSAARAKRKYARSLQPTLTTAHNPRGPKLTRDEELALAVDIAMGREPSFEASARATRRRHRFDTAMMVATGVGRGDRLFSNQYGDQRFNDPWDYANAAMLLPFGRPARGAVAAAVGARAIAKGGAKEGVEAAAKYYSGEGILRPLSRTRMARRIMRLNPDIGFAKAAKLAAEESRKPGMLAAQGIDGGVAPRVLKGAKGEAAGVAQSQSTLGRGFQATYDAASRKIDRWRPTAKFSTSHRAAKALGLEQARRTKMLQNEIARLEREVNKALPGVFQGSVRKTTAKYATKSRPLKEALLAAHEAPDFMTAREAVETKIQDLRDLLAAQGDARFSPTDHATFNEAMALNPEQHFLTPHSEEDMRGATMLLSRDGNAGGAVKPDGEMVNLFRNPGGEKGSGLAVLEELIRRGGTHLDVFDEPALVRTYERAGMREVARTKFVDEFAPDGWDYEKRGRPDIVFMAKVDKGRPDHYVDSFDMGVFLARTAGKRHGQYGAVGATDAISSQLNDQISHLEASLKGGVLESDKFAHASDAMAEMSAMGEDIYARVYPDITPEDMAARKNLVVQRWHDQGLLDGHDIADLNARGYYPHKNLLAKIGDDPSMAPSQFGAGTAGVPQKTKAAFETRKNELINYERGDIQAEPRALSNTVRSRVRYENTVEAREFMWKNGQPIKRGQLIQELIDAKNILVRNPHYGAEKIPDEVRAALDDPQKYAEWAKDWIYDGTGAMPQWVHDVESVRTFPESLARTLVGDAFAANPPGNIAAMWSMVGAVPRLALIYAPYGGARYTVRNTVQNMVLLAVTHPTAFKEFNEVIVGLRRTHPSLYNAIKAEAGTPLAAAGLPAVRSTTKGAIQKTAKTVSKASQKAADTLGNIADEPYRVMSWLRYAKSYGFESPTELDHLLTSRAPEITQVRNNIAQFVRDDMLDFDALPVKLQQSLRGFAFLPSFTYAAAKWPVMFAREYPVRAAVLALLTAQRVRETGGWEQSNTFDVAGKPVDTTWIHPLGPVVGFGQDMQKISESSGPGELTANIASAAGNPILRQAINPYSSWEDILKVITPGWSTVENLKSSRSPIDKALKSVGSQVEQPYKEKKDQDSIDKWVAEAEKISGKTVPAEVIQWKKTDQIHSRVESEYKKKHKIDGATNYQEKLAILALTMKEVNPSNAAHWDSMSEQAMGMSEDDAKAQYEAGREGMGLGPLGRIESQLSDMKARARADG